MADAHHHAAHDHERRRGKAILLGPEQCADDDIATGLQLAVHLHDDAIAQLVEHEHLLRFRETELPREPRVLEAGQRRRAGSAVMTRDEHDVGMCLGHTSRHRAHAPLRDELHVDPRLGIRVLQVVDELRQILDRIDVVVRRRRDQSHIRRRKACLRDPGIHLRTWELSALAGLGSLCHLDLQVGRIDEIFARHAESCRCDLLDRAAPRVAIGVANVARGILAALAGVRLAAEPVHRDRQGLMRFLADRAVRHRAGGEPLENPVERLDVVDRHGRTGRLEPEEPAQRRQVLVLAVNEPGCSP